MRLLLLLCLLPGLAVAVPLEEALLNLVKVNPAVRAAAADVRVAQAETRSAVGAMLPTVEGTASFTDTWEDVNGTELDSTTRAYGVNASYPLFSGGALLAARSAAKANQRAQEATFKDTWQNTALNLIQAYLGTLHDEEVLALYQNQVTVLQEQLTATQRRYDVGEVTRTDVAQAQARLATAKANRASAQGQLLATRAQLAAVYGSVPATLTWPTLPVSESAVISELEPTALRQHPRILAANERRRQSKANVRAERADFLPQASIDASYSSSEGGQFFNGSPADTEATSLGLNVSLPLFEGGQRVNDVMAAQARRRVADQNLEAARRQTLADLTEAYYSRNAAQLSYDAFDASVTANQLATQGVRLEGELGQRSVLDVLDAEQELLNAKVQLTAARRDLIVADYALRAALGELAPAMLGDKLEAALDLTEKAD